MDTGLLGLMEDILGPSTVYTNDECYFDCPFCSKHRKLAINIASHKWQCWSCLQRGNYLKWLFTRLNCSERQWHEFVRLSDEHIPTDEIPTNIILSLPDEYKPLWEHSTLIAYNQAIQYLKRRGIVKEDILRYQLGYCTDGDYQHRIIIPSYDKDNQLNYFTGRLYRDAFGERYLNPGVSRNVVTFESHVYWDYPITLVEGPFDAIAVRCNAIPVLGKTTSKALYQQLLNANVPCVYLALDQNELAAALWIAEQLLLNGKQVKLVSLNDKDPSVIGFAGMQQLMKTAKEVDFGTLLKLKVTK